MTSSNFMACTAVLVLLLITSAKVDNSMMPPFHGPFMGNICSVVDCGKGNCSMDMGSPYNFSCACDNGWKRTPLDNETGFEFLPCIVPNCSLNYSCIPDFPNAPAWTIPSNISYFDPCDGIYCGRGTCSKNTTYSHMCQCDSGCSNLFRTPRFPCYSNCSLGSDCQKLGINVSTTSSLMQGSQATALLPGKFQWMATFCVFMTASVNAMVLWK